MKSILCLLVGMIILSCVGPVSVKENEVGDPQVNAKGDSELDVVTTALGMAYPKEGDILQIRLYDSGEFEYDDFPDYDPPRATARNIKIERKKAKLNLAARDEIFEIVESAEFLNLLPRYKSPSSHFDTSWTTTVRYKGRSGEKIVVLENVWDVQHMPELRKEFPAILLQLLEKIEISKGEAIGRISYQWLAKP